MKSINKTLQSKEMSNMESQVYSVTENNRPATVTQQGDTYLADDGSMTRRVSFQVLVNLARHGETPEWCGQIPGLLGKIEGVFVEERSQGRDPFTRVASERGKISVTDLKSGAAHGADIAHLKKLLRDGKPLPRAFSSLQARQLILAV